MLDYVYIYLIVMGYLIAGDYLVKFIRKRLAPTNPYVRSMVISFAYATIFGIGILGGDGGDPGFAFPFPIILAVLIYIWEWAPAKIFFTGVIIPLGFWWTLVFIVMLIKDMIKRRRRRRSSRINARLNQTIQQ